MITVNELKEAFELIEDQELAPLFGRKKGAVSVWRKEGVPPAIERRAYELMQERGIVPGIKSPGTAQRNRSVEMQLLIAELEHLSATEQLELLLEIRKKKAAQLQQL